MSIPYVESYLGTNIYYEEYGKKNDQALVLVVGLASNMLQWHPDFIDQLEEKYRVILIDNRGSGRSGSSIRFYTMKTYSKDILMLLNHLEIPNAHFLGHSMGGSIVLRFVIRNPNRVNKIALISPEIGGLKRRIPRKAVLKILMRGMSSKGIDAIQNAVYCTENKPPPVRQALNYLERVFRYYPISKNNYWKQLLSVLSFATLNKTREIKNQTIVFSAQYDEIIRPRNSKILVRALGNGECVSINCGHMLLREDLISLVPKLHEFFA
jgi:pimeloyl-ACP methyl ester carboxylesterase